jgi:hypothetical protein
MFSGLYLSGHLIPYPFYFAIVFSLYNLTAQIYRQFVTIFLYDSVMPFIDVDQLEPKPGDIIEFRRPL